MKPYVINNLNHFRTLAARLLAAALLLASAASALADVHYVDANGANATPPYTNWATAATNIQDAVDAAVAGDEVVVTNGTYASGGRAVYGTMTNRVAVDKPLTLRSVNGPQFTIIQGYHVPGSFYGTGDGAIRCVYLTNGASLSGFTLTNGATRAVSDYPTNRESSGGGLWCESINAVVVSNSVVASSSAYAYGGGVYQGTLLNCTLAGNSAKAHGGDYYNANNATYGGGAYGCRLDNCTLTNNSAMVETAGEQYAIYTSAYGGGAAQCILNNCTLARNSASTHSHFDAYDYGPDIQNSSAGGAVFDCVLTNCALTGNWAGNYYSNRYYCNFFDFIITVYSTASGGGAADSALTRCTLVGNSAWNSYHDQFYDLYGYGPNFTLTGSSTASGGGASDCALNNCALSGNAAWTDDGDYYYSQLSRNTLGGGAGSSALNNCTLSSNSWDAVTGCTLRNCALTANSGKGAVSSTLINCTLTGNFGGGESGCKLTNCIAYFNSGFNYDSSNTLSYCCTTPLPTNGVGNISQDPELASASHLSAFSPCIGKANPAAASGTDIDGELWANPPSIGCDEYHAGAVTGLLSVGITALVTNVATGYPVKFTGLIEGPTDLSVWEFGDGAVEINQPYTSHAWSAPGDYVVSLWAFNDSYPGGLSATVTVHVINEVHYVTAGSANPLAPYTSWSTAATNIQDAIAAAVLPGAHVVVSNGTYAPISTYYLPVTVSSVNGAPFTIIDGGHSNTCAFLFTDAILSGFTFANGYGNYGGGVYGIGANSATLNNCTLIRNSVSGYYGAGGGGAYRCTLNNCFLTGNSAGSTAGPGDGGGAYECELNHCTLTGNYASSRGGGAWNSILNDCTLTGNSATFYGGGGAAQCTLSNCTLTTNSSPDAGGGAYSSSLNNCTLTGNSADFGGGAYRSTLNNCILTGNSFSSATSYGYLGGAYYCTLRNCALTGNSGGASVCALNNCTLTGNTNIGANNCTLTNCIVYFNGGTNYDSSCALSYCCTTPQPTNGAGNISSDPQLASLSHLSAASPCRGAGNAAYTSGTDIDGEAWLSPPSIGCDEYHAGALTGPLSLGITASLTNVLQGYTVQLTALIQGLATASVWDFGDGVTLSNKPYSSHAWAALGDYVVVLRAYNDSNPGGVSATVTVHVIPQPVHYVMVNNANPVLPYTSWAMAATNIQDAVDAATVPGALVLVTNGTYATGARTANRYSNRVVMHRDLTVQSVNGPQFTLIDGGHSVRCVYLAENTGLAGFTLTNGSIPYESDVPFYNAYGGGGLWCESSTTVVVSNCVIAGNSADWYGGGAFGGRLVNCALTGNSSASRGGGAYGSTLANCTLTKNSTTYEDGGGADQCTLNNCIVYYNSGQFGANYDVSSALSYCCTTPQPASGVGNITNAPLFVDTNGWANLRLQSNSPCINAGNNAYAVGSTDLDGNPRIAGGTVDIGAYEFQAPASRISYAWLQQYGLPTDGSADFTDPDGDGLNNWQEWIAGTIPTDASSVLKMFSPSNNVSGLNVSWQSVSGKNYFIQRSTNLLAQPAFSSIQSNLVGQAGTTIYTDTNAVGAGPFFYRVGVGE